MIRCSCGQYFTNSCSHTTHKLMQRAIGEYDHVTVCSECGRRFLNFSHLLPNVTFDENGRPNGIVCSQCKSKREG